MKFKQLRRLIEQYDLHSTITEGYKGIMVPGLNSQQASDGSVGLHELDKPEMIERINAFIMAFLSNVPQSGTVDPRGLLVQLRVELNKIGLDFKYDGKHYPDEHMEFHLTQFGGRKGIDNNGKKLEDDGISHRLGHGLKLVMDMQHPPETGFHSIQAKVVEGDAPAEKPHEGGSEAASTYVQVKEDVKKKLMTEEKDDCYYKVKARYDVWPSAYASGALAKCRKVGAKNWGNKSKD